LILTNPDLIKDLIYYEDHKTKRYKGLSSTDHKKTQAFRKLVKGSSEKLGLL
jgi:hypothetical protein